ncbi:MAG: polyphosphate kinase 1 [Victivallales bacterium]
MKLSKEYFISRDLSWLDFNSRVLEEATDRINPVLERLKFIAIFANNLDEFFMVRVAGLKHVRSGDTSVGSAQLTAGEHLAEIRRKVSGLVEKQYACLNSEILPDLKKANTIILRWAELSDAEKLELGKYFQNQIFPALTPIAVDSSHPFPIINSGAIELAVKLKQPNSNKIVQSFVEVPGVLPRFIPVSSALYKDAKTYILLEDLIIENIGYLYAKCEILEVMQFRITRDMDLMMDEDGISDLLVHIQEKLLHTKKRNVIRLELIRGGNTVFEEWLMKKLEIDGTEKYYVPGPLHPGNFFELVSKESRPGLTEDPWPPLPVNGIDENKPVLDSVKKEGMIPVFLPFQKFDPIVRLLEEAAEDPSVLAIKQTLYRVSGDSPVVRALQKAAENGKQVTVIVELKARFDENNNILRARRLEESGAHVIYGISGLKIHCKSLLIIRKEEGVIRRYLHLSTGNYNEKTARVYTDIGILTSDPELCSDVSALFNVMTGYAAAPERWNKISVAPYDLKEKFISLIDREIRLSDKHNPGHLIAKMNSLVDQDIIEHLYGAACAGVKVDLIVRGICCLKPGIKTDNINVTSIVDRFLEHSRIYYFGNGGNPEYYLSSADMMPRNLYKRIEVFFPVENASTCRSLKKILDLQLADSRKGRKLDGNGVYSATAQLENRNIASRSQKRIYDFFKETTRAGK